MKNHDFTPTNLIFSNFRGGGACRVRPPGSAPGYDKMFMLQDSNITMGLCKYNRIGGAMVSMLASSANDRGFEPQSGQTKDYTIGICCFSDKHAALRRKSKDGLARNQANASERGDMLFQ